MMATCNNIKYTIFGWVTRVAKPEDHGFIEQQ
jgi:hypothetical protein